MARFEREEERERMEGVCGSDFGLMYEGGGCELGWGPEGS